jgi:hypothetical protein
MHTYVHSYTHTHTHTRARSLVYINTHTNIRRFIVKSVESFVRYGCILLLMCSFRPFCALSVSFYPLILGIVCTGNGVVVYDRQIEHLIALEQRKRDCSLVTFLNSSTVDKFYICSQFCHVVNFNHVLRISSDCTEQGSIIAGV